MEFARSRHTNPALIPTVIKNDRRYEPWFRAQPPANPARIPTCANDGRVIVCTSWYHTAALGLPYDCSAQSIPEVVCRRERHSGHSDCIHPQHVLLDMARD
jgi:hypothetical protein